MKFLTLSFAPALALAALAGCQAVYPTQFVPSSPLIVDYENDTYDFKVVNLTPSSAMEANQVWAYTPRPTPAGLRAEAAPEAGFVVRATSLGTDADDDYLIAQVSDNVSTFNNASDFRNPPPTQAQPYRIGVGDVFTVTIESVANGTGGPSAYQRETTVDYAGNIYLTDVGEVQVLDLTVGDARQLIADRFRDARLSANGSATITGFNSQKVLVLSPGRTTSYLPITTTPVTLRDAYLRFSSGIDTDAARQIVVLRRGRESYPIRAQNVLRQSYGYDVVLLDEDEIQIFDNLVNEFPSASVSGEVLALRQSELDRRRFETEQSQFNASEIRADRAEQRAEEAAQLARENAEFARQTEARAREQLEIARLNAQLAQSADARSQLDQARADREEARRDAADARARAAEARADAQAARDEAAAQRAARQLDLSEQSYGLTEQSNSLNQRNSAQDLAESRINLGIAGQDSVFISGEVGAQKAIAMPFDRQYTLAEALYSAEGIEPITGDPTRIYVVRAKSSVAGSVQSYIFNFDGGNLANTPAMTMFQMRPNDLVVVMPRRVTNWSRFISQLLPTFSSLVSAARLGV